MGNFIEINLMVTFSSGGSRFHRLQGSPEERLDTQLEEGSFQYTPTPALLYLDQTGLA